MSSLDAITKTQTALATMLNEVSTTGRALAAVAHAQSGAAEMRLSVRTDADDAIVGALTSALATYRRKWETAVKQYGLSAPVLKFFVDHGHGDNVIKLEPRAELVDLWAGTRRMIERLYVERAGMLGRAGVLDSNSFLDSLGRAIADAPHVVGQVVGDALRGAGEAVGSAGAGLFSGLGLVGTLVLIAVVVVAIKVR